MGGAGVGMTEIPESDGVEAVQVALQAGINYIDTSPLYSESETRFGLALRGVPRDSYILSTKTGTHKEHWKDYSGDGTRWTVENSLKTLGVEYIDLLLVHDPDDIEPVFAKGGALDTLEQLRNEGVIRYIGLGQRNHAFHRRAIASNRFDVILTFLDYTPIRTTALTGGLLQAANDAQVGVINGSPFSFGLLAGDPAPWADFDGTREGDMAAKFRKFCQEKGVPPEAVALQHSLRQPLVHCTLTGAKNAHEVRQNLEAGRAALPPGIWDELENLHLTEGQE
jgi:aryl-alcohol dehydrogenase-like predicted oxidoreductase